MKRNSVYVDKMLRADCFEELWPRFRNAQSPVKEISESYAAFSTMKRYCEVSEHDWLHIGDGSYTRTASVFSFFSKSANWSIDPKLNVEKFENWVERYKVKRLFAYEYKFEEVGLGSWYGVKREKPTSITAVHACGISLEEIDKHYPNWTFLYSNICCKPSEQTFSKEYMEANGIEELDKFEDFGILSSKRKVVIYKNNRKEMYNGC